MARVDFRASRKTALPTFKKYHRLHQKIVRNAVKRRNQASVFDHLALSSFHTFSLSIRHPKSPPKPHVLEQERLSARKQARRWLENVIVSQHDLMSPSRREREAFVALTMLPTDQALYKALTEEKVFRKVKMMYARLFRERERARKEQGIKYYTIAVADWWVVHEVEKKLTKAEKKAKKKVRKAGKMAHKAERKAEQAKMRAEFENLGKAVADPGIVKGHNEVDWENLGGEGPQQQGKGEQIFAFNMPLRGPRI